MLRRPTLLKGTLHLSNGTWSVEILDTAAVADGSTTDLGFREGAEIEILMWDRSASTTIERIAQAQQVDMTEAAQGFASRGALHGSNVSAGTAPFVSRIATQA